MMPPPQPLDAWSDLSKSGVDRRLRGIGLVSLLCAIAHCSVSLFCQSERASVEAGSNFARGNASLLRGGKQRAPTRETAAARCLSLIVPAKASRGQLPLVSSQTRERVPHSSMQNTAQCKAIHYYLLYLLIHPSPGTRLV